MEPRIVNSGRTWWMGIVIVGTAFVGDVLWAAEPPFDPRPLHKESAKEHALAPDQFKFLVFGDSKLHPDFEHVLRYADLFDPAFVVTTGDLVDKGAGDRGKIEYKMLQKQAGWFFAKYPTWPIVGNHEVAGGHDGLEQFQSFFGLEDEYYTFEFGNCKFMVLGWHRVTISEDRLKWLEAELKSGRDADQHLFVITHCPYYTVGYKSTREIKGSPTPVTELMAKYKVAALFAGHDHIYYRTKRDGVTHVTSAGAGAGIYTLRREDEAIEGDVYYGRDVANKEARKKDPSLPRVYRYRGPDGKVEEVGRLFYFVLEVTVDGDQVGARMIDVYGGKVWDEFAIR